MSADKGKAHEAVLTADRARKLLSYDSESGVFRWRDQRGPCGAGQVAGTTRRDGYAMVCLDWRKYYAHRVAWLITHGNWPAYQLDHINGNPSDNRLANLRECSNAENLQNLGVRKSNTSGAPGVVWCAERGKWAAQIRIDGRVRALGRFFTKEEAMAAHATAKLAAHTFQPTQRI